MYGRIAQHEDAQVGLTREVSEELVLKLLPVLHSPAGIFIAVTKKPPRTN
jgi:hypothetical protein